MFKDLLDKTIIEIDGLKRGSETVIFKCSDGSEYRMYHYQDCCETVSIEDVIGDVEDLLNLPILIAEEVSSCDDVFNENTPNITAESCTWTFYKLCTYKGFVTIRWFGESNGYYSESVSFEKIKG